MLSVITMAVRGSVKRMDCTRWTRRGFVESDVDEGPAVVQPERRILQPGGLGLVQFVIDRPRQLLVDRFLAGLDGVAHHDASHLLTSVDLWLMSVIASCTGLAMLAAY